MVIEVTAEDIAQGKRLSPLCCPVALALKRHTGKPISVACYLVREDASPRKWCGFAKEVWDFLLAFDTGKPVQPFTFELPDALLSD